MMTVIDDDNDDGDNEVGEEEDVDDGDGEKADEKIGFLVEGGRDVHCSARTRSSGS